MILEIIIIKYKLEGTRSTIQATPKRVQPNLVRLGWLTIQQIFIFNGMEPNSGWVQPNLVSLTFFFFDGMEPAQPRWAGLKQLQPTPHMVAGPTQQPY